jgi:hypothetical protein
MVAALQPITDTIPELQIYGSYNENPSPPSIDMWPATPFQIGAGMGVGNTRVWYVVRAVLAVGDLRGAYDQLLELLDPNGPASVEAALANVDVVVDTINGEITGIGPFTDVSDAVGATWRVGAYL